MKYLVAGIQRPQGRFHESVFASCPREAEIFVYLKGLADQAVRRVACVYDENRRVLHSLDAPEPELLSFDDLLSELYQMLIAGRVAVSASTDLQWLADTVEAGSADHYFYSRAERLAARPVPPTPASDWYREALIRLSSIGLGLLEAKSIPQTQALYDSMFQVRVTSILYGPILESAFKTPRLKLVKNV